MKRWAIFEEGKISIGVATVPGSFARTIADVLNKRATRFSFNTMSVCTGAFHLAQAGLLAGKPATTHHDFVDRLEKNYPDIKVVRGVRFVEGDRISTAGGLS